MAVWNVQTRLSRLRSYIFIDGATYESAAIPVETSRERTKEGGTVQQEPAESLQSQSGTNPTDPSSHSGQLIPEKVRVLPMMCVQCINIGLSPNTVVRLSGSAHVKGCHYQPRQGLQQQCSIRQSALQLHSLRVPVHANRKVEHWLGDPSP